MARLISTFLCVAFAVAAQANLLEKYSWSQLDFAYTTEIERDIAITSEAFIPENCVPTGIAVWTDKKVFVTIPRDKGVPATLAYFSLDDCSTSPKLIPYPSFCENEVNGCNGIVSVNGGVRIDKWNRLWILDSGKVGRGEDACQECPPRIHVYDLTCDVKLRTYYLRDCDYNAKSIFRDIVVDSGDSCDQVYLYIADQSGGLIVYSWEANDSWRFEHPYFWPDPIFCDYNVAGYNFQLPEVGLFGMALSAENACGYKTLYFHALSSYREFSVSTEVLQNKCKVSNNFSDFKYVGSRECLGHSTSEVVAKSKGVLFFNLIDKNAVGCWNTAKPYVEQNLAIVAKDDSALIYPCSIVLDCNDVVWVMSNKEPIHKNGQLSCTETNFRILSACVSDLIAGTVCECP